jgi:hypothetical protein
MEKREYTIEDIEAIAEQLKAIQVQGKPVFEVETEPGKYGGWHRVTLKTWGTTAINEFPAKRE